MRVGGAPPPQHFGVVPLDAHPNVRVRAVVQGAEGAPSEFSRAFRDLRRRAPRRRPVFFDVGEGFRLVDARGMSGGGGPEYHEVAGQAPGQLPVQARAEGEEEGVEDVLVMRRVAVGKVRPSVEDEQRAEVRGRGRAEVVVRPGLERVGSAGGGDERTPQFGQPVVPDVLQRHRPPPARRDPVEAQSARPVEAVVLDPPSPGEIQPVLPPERRLDGTPDLIQQGEALVEHDRIADEEDPSHSHPSRTGAELPPAQRHRDAAPRLDLGGVPPHVRGGGAVSRFGGVGRVGPVVPVGVEPDAGLAG
mmetsp:Transcript_14929/g.43484  ORF Transcript_14929/g.43484 Transcript_14929/m.43484 type:complete len:304 (-) Transcript_14929:439-1350(-)